MSRREFMRTNMPSSSAYNSVIFSKNQDLGHCNSWFKEKIIKWAKNTAVYHFVKFRSLAKKRILPQKKYSIGIKVSCSHKSVLNCTKWVYLNEKLRIYEGLPYRKIVEKWIHKNLRWIFPAWKSTKLCWMGFQCLWWEQ